MIDRYREHTLDLFFIKRLCAITSLSTFSNDIVMYFCLIILLYSGPSDLPVVTSMVFIKANHLWGKKKSNCEVKMGLWFLKLYHWIPLRTTKLWIVLLSIIFFFLCNFSIFLNRIFNQLECFRISVSDEIHLRSLSH